METTAISPAILYWGTPVVFITTENIDGSSNITPMSSAWWLGHRCVVGLGTVHHGTQNLFRTKQCVLNLPNASMGHFVNAIARTTGTEHIDATKTALGYRHVKDKWSISGMTPVALELVSPPRIKECPVQMEAELCEVHPMMGDMAAPIQGIASAIELKILRVYVDSKIRMDGHPNRIDPDKWNPMIMSFQELYGLDNRKIAKSRLGEIEEEKYRILTGTETPEDKIDEGETAKRERRASIGWEGRV